MPWVCGISVSGFAVFQLVNLLYFNQELRKAVCELMVAVVFLGVVVFIDVFLCVAVFLGVIIFLGVVVFIAVFLCVAVFLGLIIFLGVVGEP